MAWAPLGVVSFIAIDGPDFIRRGFTSGVPIPAAGFLWFVGGLILTAALAAVTRRR